MTAQSILDIYDSVEEFAAILTSAELHASGAWELDFVENMRASFKRYAAHTNLTPLQQQHLERIAKH
ncbi:MULTISPECIES: hypothetical protein [unclassified Pseudomonas]|mgnify:CR=1 FL=1|jgi:hypothetical protein|uniref:hypothetical protein n=1 Tax=unclassified Pseudomonas TaxID=196821 RepID=UPI0020058FC6|nr:hypothetical protein [Pseudomonas sp. W2Jun17]MCK3849971.1 hypothetical protein [Pseudomonas sp. W2Jun17]